MPGEKAVGARIGSLSPGSHSCHFYQTRQDFIDTSIRYLADGLAARQRGLWVVPEAISIEEARDAFVRAVPDDRANHLEIVASRDWYLGDGKLNLPGLLHQWKEKQTEALQHGYWGLWVMSGVVPVAPGQWVSFCAYEQELNESVGPSLTLNCSYALDRIGSSDVLDLIGRHRFATRSWDGQWDLLETAVLEQEIEGRQRAEEALLKNQRRFQALFDEAVIGILLFDPTGQTQETNRSLQTMLGYSGEELRRMTPEHTFKRLIPTDREPAARQRFLDLTTGVKAHYTLEERYIRKDGSLLWAKVTVSLVRHNGGGPIFGVVLVEDVTERRRTQEALARSQAELAHVSRVMTMGEMVASIAHEVNQPLTAVFTNAQACLRWLTGLQPHLEEARAAVERIIADSGRAGQVLARISLLIKKTEPQKVWLDINELVREVIDLSQKEAESNHVVVRSDLADGLPSVMGDRVQLQQVVLNLILNGVEAMGATPIPQRQLQLRTRLLPPGWVRVEVQDSGVGLDPAAQISLFEAFFTTKPGGLGMGLSISRSIVEAHGGTLGTRANPTGGATFHFDLPVDV